MKHTRIDGFARFRTIAFETLLALAGKKIKNYHSDLLIDFDQWTAAAEEVGRFARMGQGTERMEARILWAARENGTYATTTVLATKAAPNLLESHKVLKEGTRELLEAQIKNAPADTVWHLIVIAAVANKFVDSREPEFELCTYRANGAKEPLDPRHGVELLFAPPV